MTPNGGLDWSCSCNKPRQQTPPFAPSPNTILGGEVVHFRVVHKSFATMHRWRWTDPPRCGQIRQNTETFTRPCATPGVQGSPSIRLQNYRQLVILLSKFTCLLLASSLHFFSAPLSFDKFSLTLGFSLNFCSASLSFARFSFTLGFSLSFCSASLSLDKFSFKTGF